jgi:ligand-binding sensor domain-containing protein/signal transduction histidine kinase
MKSTFFVICFLLLSLLPGLAQEYNFVRYDTKDGLAGSVVYDMAQDRDGFIWFATETGVSRFDGTHFKNFTVAEGLPDNEVIGLYVDSRNRVWMQPFSNGICYYLNGTIYNKYNDSILSRLNVTSYVRFIIENQQGDLALVIDTKIFILKKDGTTRTFEGSRGNPFETAAAGGLNSNDNFVFGMSQAGYQNKFEYRNDSLCLLTSWQSNVALRYPIHFSKGLEIFLDGKINRIDIITGSGAIKLPINGYLKSERLNDSIIVNAWSAYIEFYNIKRQKTERTIYAGKNVNDFLEDTEGNWWFSSMGSGVYRLPSTEIKNYYFKPGNETFPVWALEKYKDTLYVGTDSFQLWKVNLSDHKKWSVTAGTGHTPGKIVTVDRMPNGLLFTGTETGIYEIASHKKRVFAFKSAVKSTHVHGDTLLVGTNWATYEIDCKNMRVIDTLQTARNTAVWKQGANYYIGTLNGLYVLDKEENPRHLGNLHPALTGKISVIRGAPDGTIWVGTYGFGIIGLKNEQVVASINADSGLTSNTCRSVYIKDAILWIGTDKGLNKVKFDGGKIVIKNYTVADGLPSDLINAILHDGQTIYLGTPVGVTFFDEEKVFTNSICQLKITGIQSPKQQWLRDTSGLEFGHYENNIRIEFAGITFKSGGDILYRYKLNGLDDTWRETRDNFLSFLSLPSGDYELELTAVNKFGVQSETLHLHFSVAKLTWEKNWFRTLVIILAALAVWLFVRYRIRKIRQETKLKSETDKKIAELEQMALKAQMNPHFIFNSLHSIQQFVIDKDVAGANKYISDFARLIRLTLDISSQSKIHLGDEINYLSTYLELEKAKYEGKFDYEVETAPDIGVESIYIPAMLLQPYVENSIRHGIYYRTDQKGRIRISFRFENEYLVCTIEDNGVGRKASEQFKSGQQKTYQSKGMSLTARRIDMLNQDYMMPIFSTIEDLYNEPGSNEISGTRVILRFPIQEVKKQA